MNAAAFLAAIRSRAKTISTHPDPLVGALTFLEEHGDTGEGRMLRRIIDTLASGKGDYAESDLYLLRDKMLAVVVALIEARERGFYSEEEWRRWRKPAP